jgi:hypothetical protein
MSKSAMKDNASFDMTHAAKENAAQASQLHETRIAGR